VADIIEIGKKTKGDGKREKLTPMERQKLIERLTEEMKEASRMLEFEKAAYLRDRIRDLRTTK
jgi:excinuclease ABC subunit B